MSFLIDFFFKNLIKVIIINSYLKIKLRDSDAYRMGMCYSEQRADEHARALSLSQCLTYRSITSLPGGLGHRQVEVFSFLVIYLLIHAQVGLMVR